MSFALAKQKGPAARWDDFRSERYKKQKRGSSLNKKIPGKPKFGVWVRTLAELTSKLFLAGVVGYLLFAASIGFSQSCPWRRHSCFKRSLDQDMQLVLKNIVEN